MKVFPVKKILILVVLLAVPGFLYYLLQDKGKNRYKPLAIFGPKQVATTFKTKRGKKIPDTIYHQIADFNLTNQNNTVVSFKNYPNKILVFNLFYTQGDQAVNLANKAMVGLKNLFIKNKMVNFVSISMDFANDKPNVLANYANKLSANANKWDLITGDSSQVYNLIKKGLLLDAATNTQAGKTNFVYTNMLVLVDPQHRIRGYYEATNPEAVSKLDDEIRVLIAEELRNVRDGR
jgi:protein SCO1